MARFVGCLREDISYETHQSGPESSRTWMTLCLCTENFRGHFFHNRNILVMKSEKTHNL